MFRGFQKYVSTESAPLGDQAYLEANLRLTKIISTQQLLTTTPERNNLLPLFAIHNSTHPRDDELPLAGPKYAGWSW